MKLYLQLPFVLQSDSKWKSYDGNMTFLRKEELNNNEYDNW